MTTFDPIYELFLNSPEERTLEELSEYDGPSFEEYTTSPLLFQDFITKRESFRAY